MKGSKSPKTLDTTHNSSPSLATHNEVKSKGIRKRKDRSHSVGSKDKKVVRSNSEERIIKKNVCNKSIRRVSSHEDFQKVSDENASSKENSSVSRSDMHSHADEYEWKRTGERQFRLPLHRRKHNYFRKSAKLRPIVTTRYEEKTQFLNNNNDEEEPVKAKPLALKPPVSKERKESPYSSPTSSVLDLSTLHKQIDCLEPIPSSTSRHVSEYTDTLPSTSVALLSSPRNSLITTERIYLDHYVAQSKGSPLKSSLNPVEKRLNNLNKQIKRNKKKIRQYEQDFEQKRGYKPSEMDKLNDPYINTIATELLKLKKDYKITKKQDKVALPVNNAASQESEESSNGATTLAETLTDIEQKLTSKRTLAERPLGLEEMTNAQLLEEKTDIQKGLLYLQTKHGRPNTKDDKDLVRALYDRYRNVKRIIARTVPSSNIIELATIHEHETLHIVPTESATSTPSSETNLEAANAQDEDAISIESTLHSLSLAELMEERKSTIEEKKRLQRSLKDFENNFRLQIGRKIKKDDKEPMLHVYDSYKKAKAKLKLLDALLKKLSSPSLYLK